MGVAGCAGQLAGACDEALAQALVLGGGRVGAHLRGDAVDVYLADHGLAAGYGQVGGVRGNKGLVGEGEAQKAGDLVFWRHPLEEVLAGGVGVVGHLVKGEPGEVDIGVCDLAVADLLHAGARALLGKAALY